MSDKNTNSDEQMLPTQLSVFKKSNFLIGSKYKSSLLENKIMAISLANAENFRITPEGNIYSEMLVSELRRDLGANSGSFYQQLNTTAQMMTGKSFGMSSPDSKEFQYIAVVVSATCKDGVFTIEYNHRLKDVLINLQKNYSRLNLGIMLRFKKNYSFRLYELLKSKCYRHKGDINQSNVYNISFQLSELKLELGVVDASNNTTKRVLSESRKNPDYDQAVSAASETMFNDWTEFRRKVLDTATTEINAMSDLTVEYIPRRHGYGGRVVGVDFKVEIHAVRKQKISDEDLSVLTDEEKMTRALEIGMILGTSFTPADVRAIAEAGGYDPAKVRSAKELYDKSSGVENPTGWMITAITQGYSRADGSKEKKEAKPKQAKKTTRKRTSRNDFNNFQQNHYDFDELEGKLII